MVTGTVASVMKERSGRICMTGPSPSLTMAVSTAAVSTGSPV